MINFTGEMTPNASRLLRRKRVERGLSVEEVAKALRVTPQTIQRWENGSSVHCQSCLVRPLRTFLESGVLPIPTTPSKNAIRFSQQVQAHVSLLLFLLKLTQDYPPLRKRLLEGLWQITDMENRPST